ncbi:hypothetical protein QR680_005566 [Steinernema hermaphroditum]|uniref:Uncharacterized protein n=1 Tax=Steinernema hermaphroditum TaxID=289476 RepID=A0AA39HSI5_9BILA|nr:hypothetical protein QR680_005566 [Steinernema hermaphroditum]
MDARAGDVDPLSTADAMLCEGHLTYLAARLPSQGDVERESDDRTVVVARDVRCRGADRSRRRSAGSSSTPPTTSAGEARGGTDFDSVAGDQGVEMAGAEDIRRKDALSTRRLDSIDDLRGDEAG